MTILSIRYVCDICIETVMLDRMIWEEWSEMNGPNGGKSKISSGTAKSKSARSRGGGRGGRGAGRWRWAESTEQAEEEEGRWAADAQEEGG